jgi:hypothetical protein
MTDDCDDDGTITTIDLDLDSKIDSFILDFDLFFDLRYVAFLFQLSS